MPALLTTTCAATAQSHPTPNIPSVDLNIALATVRCITFNRVWALVTAFTENPDSHITHSDYSLLSRAHTQCPDPTWDRSAIDSAILFILTTRLARHHREHRTNPDAPVPTLINRMLAKVSRIAKRRGYQPLGLTTNNAHFVAAGANRILMAAHGLAVEAAQAQNLPVPPAPKLIDSDSQQLEPTLRVSFQKPLEERASAEGVPPRSSAASEITGVPPRSSREAGETHEVRAASESGARHERRGKHRQDPRKAFYTASEQGRENLRRKLGATEATATKIESLVASVLTKPATAPTAQPEPAAA